MLRVRDGVKFGASRVCPKCNRPLWQSLESVQTGSEMMSAFEEHKEELEKFEQMFGRERGRLAGSLDPLTKALVLGGPHGLYCTNQRNPKQPGNVLGVSNKTVKHGQQHWQPK